MTKQPSFNYLSLEDYDTLNELIYENIEEILDSFGVEYVKTNEIRCACPLHQGDNNSAVQIRENFWWCYTQNCQAEYGCSLVGFISGLLSSIKYRKVTQRESIEWLRSKYTFSLNGIGDGIDAKEFKDRRTFSILVNSELKPPTEQDGINLSIEEVRSKLVIPSPYFLSRGFRAETLDNFHVGDCNNPRKPMRSRAVVPIIDNDGNKVIACTGRSFFEKCGKCHQHHSHISECNVDAISPKWKHSGWSKMSQCLYNFHHLNSLYNDGKIDKHKNSVIIVESPGDLWRLYEGGYENTVCIFGCNFSDNHLSLLLTLPIISVVIMTNFDAAGRKAANDIRQKCRRYFNVFSPLVPNINDIGEIPSNLVRKKLRPILEPIFERSL